MPMPVTMALSSGLVTGKLSLSDSEVRPTPAVVHRDGSTGHRAMRRAIAAASGSAWSYILKPGVRHLKAHLESALAADS